MKAVKVLSGNAIKLAEIRALLEHPIEAVDHVEPEIQSTDPSSVVLEKLNCATARALSESGFVVLAEDTALHLAGWNGLPGALVSWFVDDMGPEKLARLIVESPLSDRATAESAVGVRYGERVATWTGKLSGRIVHPRGDLGGWTPIFEIAGWGRTLGELDLTERLRVTMRREPLLRASRWVQRHCSTEEGRA